jgi:hypothetical protein
MAVHCDHESGEEIGDRSVVDQDRTVSVYVLRDADGRPRYVGQTANPRLRLWHHWRKNRFPTDSDKPLDHWLRSLSEKPTLDVLEVVPYAIRFAVEREWTLALLANGHDLLNVAIGSSLAPETISKMSAGKRGRPLTDDHRAKISKGLSEGRKIKPAEKPPRTLAPEHREKLLRSNLGRVVTEETKAQIAETLRGHEVSEETRRKIGEASRNRTLSEETRAKIGAAHRGKKVPEETKVKMREAAQRRVERQRVERENSER